MTKKSRKSSAPNDSKDRTVRSAAQKKRGGGGGENFYSTYRPPLPNVPIGTTLFSIMAFP